MSRPPLPPPAPAAAPAISILVCIVTRGRQDASIPCAVSMLQLQTLMMSTARPISADLQFVQTTNDALNVLKRHESVSGVLLVDSTMGFDPEFPMHALASGLPVVAGSYPLPLVDWERVKQQPQAEDPSNWGNVYSIKPSGRIGPTGYAHVTEARLGVAWVRKDVVDSIVAKHPEIVDQDGIASFALDGIYDGVRRTADQRFFDLVGGDVWADIQRPATSSGPIEFTGCVGRRSVLR